MGMVEDTLRKDENGMEVTVMDLDDELETRRGGMQREDVGAPGFGLGLPYLP